MFFFYIKQICFLYKHIKQICYMLKICAKIVEFYNMTDKMCKEWTLNTIWGKLALVSWGDPSHPPVLLLHGYVDSAATFIPLLRLLPEEYFYVGIDFPGHGKSDPFPAGFQLYFVHMVEAIRLVVDYMNWENFVVIAHSMGFITGVYYNAIHPHRISKMVELDPWPAMSVHYYIKYKIQDVITYLIEISYGRSIVERLKHQPAPKLVTYEEAVAAIVDSRKISERSAEIVLSRCLVPVGDGLYQFSWDPRVKRMGSILIHEEMLINVITTKAPPILSINATNHDPVPPEVKEFADKIYEKIKTSIPVFIEKNVEGGHDVHITNPELLAPIIADFLYTNFGDGDVRAKL